MAFQDKNSILIDDLKLIKNELKEKKLRPFYFLYGDENYLIEETYNRIKKIFVDDSGINFKLYEKDNFDIEKVIAYIESFPIMNDKKLIVFKDVPFFRQKKNSEKDEKDQAAFINAIEENKDQNIIIVKDYIDYDEKEKDKNYEKYFGKTNKIAIFFKNNGILINLHRFNDTTLSTYVIQRFKKANKIIDKVEAAYIVRNIGNDIETIYNECDKVIAYVGDKEKIERVDLDNALTRSIDDNIFNLISFINNNKYEMALRLYGDLLTSGFDEMLIIAMLVSNYKNLIISKSYIEKGKSKSEIANLMGMAPWQVERFIDASKSTTTSLLEEKLDKAVNLSVRISDGNIDKELVPEILFL